VHGNIKCKDVTVGKGKIVMENTKHYLSHPQRNIFSFQLMAVIRAEPTMVKSFVLNIIEVRHLSEFNCIDPNDSIE